MAEAEAAAAASVPERQTTEGNEQQQQQQGGQAESGPQVVETVELDGLCVLKIMRHCKDSLPVLVAGQLLGLDVKSTLEVTDCFPIPSGDSEEDDSASYQMEKMELLREVNVDSMPVGWYQSTYLDSFVNESLISTQFSYQSSIPNSVVLIHDPVKAGHGNLSLKAYRLTPQFMAMYRTKKFTPEALKAASLTYDDVLYEVKVQIVNSPVMSSMLYQLAPDAAEEGAASQFDRLTLSSTPFVEKNLEMLVDAIDSLSAEQNKLQYYHRRMAQQRAQQASWLARRQAENAARRAAGQEPLPEDTADAGVWKATAPNRLDALLDTCQVSKYCQQLQTYTSHAFTKLFLAEGVIKKTPSA